LKTFFRFFLKVGTVCALSLKIHPKKRFNKMGFRINTNISAMNAHNYGVMNNRELDSALAKLSSGLRINTAADDASGMAIADSLLSQANALGQAVKNANDAIGIIQTADKAMDEQIKILDTIKVKATQAAQDGQSSQSRQALQNDITRLLEELDNIASTTSFNGMKLLAGSFTNKEFQIGAYSNETVKASIGATNVDKIGSVRFETTTNISAAGISSLVFQNTDGTNTTLRGATISHSAATGLGTLAVAINNASDITGVRASYKVVSTGISAVKAGSIENLIINGITVGDVLDVKASDADGTLVNTINAVTSQTGVYASVDVGGRITLTSTDGRGIKVEAGDKNYPTMNTLEDVLQMPLYDMQGTRAVAAGPISANFQINGVAVGPVAPGGDVVAAINAKTSQTGVVASLGASNQLVLTSTAGGAIQLTSGTGADAQTDSDALGISVGTAANTFTSNGAPGGTLTLSSTFAINGITIGANTLTAVPADVVNHINSFTAQTGVTASLSGGGNMVLTTNNGKLNVSSGNAADATADATVLGMPPPPSGAIDAASGKIIGYTATENDNQNYGRLTLTSLGAKDILVSDANGTLTANINSAGANTILNLGSVRGNYTASQGLAAGAYANQAESGGASAYLGSGVTTRTGAMMVMDIAESAMKLLDKIRADLGSVQNQLTVTINNISTTHVSVKAAESQIRDVDFAEESANFSKRNILAQSGSFAMAQANTIQQNVLKLLQ